MFKHILVPVDFAPKNAAAIEVAVNLAQQYQARITVLHVIEPIQYEDDEARTFYQMLEAKAWAKMKSTVEQLDRDDVQVIEHIVLGHRASCIVDYTSAHCVDLLVLSSHQIEFDQIPKSLGTLSYQLSVLCPCPVFLLK